jgi:exosome complex RNA-binding protein Rrp42 (RNase PH superfamily)
MSASSFITKELLSSNEMAFMTQGIAEFGIRIDGRKIDQRRRRNFEENPVVQALGSSRVTITDSSHTTDVLIAVKGEFVQDPSLAGVKVTVESSHCSSTNQKNRLEDRNAILSLWFSRLINESRCLDFDLLVISPNSFYWSLVIEVLVISDLGGSLVDCIGLGIRKALQSCRLPQVSVEVSGDNEALSVSDDPSLSKALSVDSFPHCFEVGLVDRDLFLVDMSPSEEHCCQSTFWTAIGESGRIFAVEQMGKEALISPQTIIQALSIALSEANK